tara:strand:- start:10556 stop:10777 length:222 start_codon:yes stop_codon:yes gene_type:complete
MSPIAALLWILALYTLIGLPVALRFVLATGPKLDPALNSAPLRVRLIFIPGAVCLWPIVLRRSATLRTTGDSA